MKMEMYRDGNLQLPRSQPSTERGLHGSLQQCPFLSRRPVQCCCCGCRGNFLIHFLVILRKILQYIPTLHSLAIARTYPSPKMATKKRLRSLTFTIEHGWLSVSDQHLSSCCNFCYLPLQMAQDCTQKKSGFLFQRCWGSSSKNVIVLHSASDLLRLCL